ncbi:hypothetical protein SACE_0896 [Saccharopolyspora erythraea NRRL 2338]|uniref:Uncharacterized protein n=1 Tax=Saccharopolyspora erythraea (strain ATCC 11635 / DSM 40517 / JCM 4748 / NBRC 13426 / NCIMB 8594 / NRRL 2338) TaxID=405948 RepID=A4F855_SACEN|nr:hypothetical protein SACE_0896 [Saccharopolyspora erythraea NRRL 2338]
MLGARLPDTRLSVGPLRSDTQARIGGWTRRWHVEARGTPLFVSSSNTRARVGNTQHSALASRPDTQARVRESRHSGFVDRSDTPRRVGGGAFALGRRGGHSGVCRRRAALALVGRPDTPGRVRDTRHALSELPRPAAAKPQAPIRSGTTLLLAPKPRSARRRLASRRQDRRGSV